MGKLEQHYSVTVTYLGNDLRPAVRIGLQCANDVRRTVCVSLARYVKLLKGGGQAATIAVTAKRIMANMLHMSMWS